MVLTIVAVLLLLRNQYLGIELEKRKKSIEDATNTLLMELIFSTTSKSQMKEKIEEFKHLIPFHKKWCNDYMLTKILDMNLIFQVDSEQHREIFRLFGFDKVSYQLLRHKKWHYKSLGIYRLQRMMDRSKRKQIRTFLHDDNPELKSNALIALVTLAPEKFAALRDFDEPLTKADEMKILDIIYQSRPEMPKNTEKLLKSKNTSIVVLGIKLLVLYKAKLSLKQICKLIWFSNFRVRGEAIKAVGKLNMTEANELLITQYSIEQNKAVKVNILKSLKNIGNQEAANFLKSLLKQEQDSDIKFEMVGSINALDPDFFERSLEPKIPNDKTIEGMVKHVKDLYLI